MKLHYDIKTDRVILLGRWLPREALHGIPRGIGFYRWRYLWLFPVEWSRWIWQVARVWLRSQKVQHGQ